MEDRPLLHEAPRQRARALAGFEKSGHYFFNKPFGRGYDDGLVSAIAICDMLDRNPEKKMADLKNALPKTWGSPTMSPHCADEKKYGVVDKVVKHSRTRRRKATRSPASRFAISSRSTACGSPSRTAPGAWCGPRPTSRNWWWWSRARCRKRACATCSRPSTRAAHASGSRRIQSDDLIDPLRMRRIRTPNTAPCPRSPPRSGQAAG